MSVDYLLDTCVIAEAIRPRPQPKLIDWLNSVELGRAYLSVVSVGEIQAGISSLPQSNRRTELEVWLHGALTLQFAGRIVPLDADTMITWGVMTAGLKRSGTPMGVMDSLIAATAAEHRMVLVTRNVNDFAVAGVSLLNPWE